MDKHFKVVSDFDGNQISWDVIRIQHTSKGDYKLATFYERGSIQLFIEKLRESGFVELSVPTE